jgi:hypothetical protein
MKLHNKQLFTHTLLSGGLFEGYVPATEPVEESLPTMAWKGGKIPFAMWQQMSSFFRHCYNEAKSESQLRLFYNEALQQWRVGPLPQKFPSGMVTKELPNHESYDSAKAALMSGGFEEKGTGHHHCSAGAFQSSTDTKDEESSTGLHLTLGDMHKPVHSFHARVVVMVPGALSSEGKVVRAAQSVQYEADVLDWFEMPEALPAWLPADLQREALLHALCCPSDVGFPPEWLDMLIKEPVRPPVKHAPPAPSGFQQPSIASTPYKRWEQDREYDTWGSWTDPHWGTNGVSEKETRKATVILDATEVEIMAMLEEALEKFGVSCLNALIILQHADHLEELRHEQREMEFLQYLIQTTGLDFGSLAYYMEELLYSE